MDNVLLSNIPFSRKWIMSWISIIAGTFILALGYVLFINPYNIVPGGVYGLGIILHSIFPQIAVGTFGLAFDVPLLITAFAVFGGHFGARTIVAAVLTPIFMNTLTYFIGETPDAMFGGHINLTDDVLLSSLFGGLLSGVGLGLIFRSHATSGGTDILAMIISKTAHLPLAKSIIYVESVVVFIGLLVFGDWKLPLYSIITIFVTVNVIDYIIEGGANDKLLFIISKKHTEIREYVTVNLERGGTYIKACGMYTNESKEMMFIVISRRELALVQSYIKEVDPEVFMVVVNAHETLGDGFKSFQDKINN